MSKAGIEINSLSEDNRIAQENLRTSTSQTSKIMAELADIKNVIKKYMEENNDLRRRLNEHEERVNRLTGEK